MAVGVGVHRAWNKDAIGSIDHTRTLTDFSALKLRRKVATPRRPGHATRAVVSSASGPTVFCDTRLEIATKVAE